jgi:vacuolar-type H+-ATPase subunit H
LDEKTIQEVLDIESRAQQIHDKAIAEADQMPRQAEKEAQASIEKAKAEAEEEARQIVAKAEAEDESTHILAHAQESAKKMEGLAMNNIDRAVTYVLARVVGKE